MRMTDDGTAFTEPQSGFWRRLFYGALDKLHDAYLVIEDQGQFHQFGDPQSPYQATVTIHDPRAFKEMVLGGALGAAEAYTLKLWDSHDVTKVVQVFARNLDILEQQGWISQLRRFLVKLDHRFNRNSINKARDNIAAHYDLGNDLFEEFLDPSMMYSSAIYPKPDATLEEAQQYRLRRICEKLCLTPKDHVLEIGTGWGGMALYAAQNFGCKVTTTTISEQQHAYTQAQIERLGLQDRITLLKEDYRNLNGQYDKLISLEMIEAVGHEYLPTYFECCSALLKPQGAMLLQAITIADQRYHRYRKNVDFIQKYIFPGGHLPSVKQITAQVAKATDMTLRHLEDFGEHYALTLREWRRRFNQSSERLHYKGYDETFQRLWNYYFAYCEGGFLERNIGVTQIVFTKPKNRHAPIVI